MRPEKLRILLMIAVVSSLLTSCGNPFSDTNRIKKGKFRQTIVETGELAAVEQQSFVMPRIRGYWNIKIIGIQEQGADVKAGDSIIQLDPMEIKKHILEQESFLQVQEANMEKLLVSQSNRRIELQSGLELAEASFKMQELAMKNIQFLSGRDKKIKQLQFEQEKLRLNKVKRSIQHSKIIAANELKIQKIAVNQVKIDLKISKSLLPMLTIRTPIPGIFQLAKNYETGNMIKIGDQVWPGTTIGSVPNLKWMKVNTSVSENDFYKLSVGQDVLVRLDATPEVTFKGEITNIAKLCHRKDNKSRLKVFDVEVKLLKSDERLKPGMTVSCEFVCKDLTNATYVPLNCVEQTEEGSFIYMKHGTSYLRTKVKTGAANNTHVILKGNYENGQEIIPVDQIENEKEKK